MRTLPTPKNHYAIVPEKEMDTESEVYGEGQAAGTYTSVENQADIVTRIEAERKKSKVK